MPPTKNARRRPVPKTAVSITQHPSLGNGHAYSHDVRLFSEYICDNNLVGNHIITQAQQMYLFPSERTQRRLARRSRRTNPLLQQNVGLRKSLQSAVKPPSARKMKDIRRGVGTMVEREVSPTPCLNMAAMRNSRFYRNNLRTLPCQPVNSLQVIELLDDSEEKRNLG